MILSSQPHVASPCSEEPSNTSVPIDEVMLLQGLHEAPNPMVKTVVLNIA